MVFVEVKFVDVGDGNSCFGKWFLRDIRWINVVLILVCELKWDDNVWNLYFLVRFIVFFFFFVEFDFG